MKKVTLFLLSFFCFLACYGQYVREEKTSTNLNELEGFSVRTNVASWGLLTPSIGAEYRMNKDWSVIVDGSWTKWNWKSKYRRFRVWQVKPQVRRYLRDKRDNYVGIEYNVGQYCIKLRDSGKQGDFMGGSISFGHQFYAAKNVMIDAGVSIGYLHISKREEYKRINGADIKMGNLKNKNYFGPTGISMTIVWKI